MGVHRHNFGLAVVCGLPVISATFVVLRLVARWRRKIRIGWDDWLLVLATLLSFGLIGPGLIEFRLFHWGYHTWEYPRTTADTSEWDRDLYRRVIIIFNLLSIPILPLCKASIIILLLHVGRILDRVRRALYAVFVFNALAAVIPWALFIFICPDAPHNTTPTVFGGLKCLDREAQGVVLVFVNSANLLTDLLVFPIPFFIMHELMNTTWRSKLTILLTFATSLCVTALTAVKIRLTEQDRIMFADCSHYHPCRAAKPDWMYSLDYCITHAEANVGIMVACIPTLRGLIFPRRQSTSTSTTSTAFSDPNRSSPFNTSFWPYNNGGRSMLGSNDPTARGSQEQQDGLTEKFGKKAGEEDGSSGRTVVLVVPQRDVLDHHTFHATPPLPPPSDSD